MKNSADNMEKVLGELSRQFEVETPAHLKPHPRVNRGDGESETFGAMATMLLAEAINRHSDAVRQQAEATNRLTEAVQRNTTALNTAEERTGIIHLPEGDVKMTVIAHRFHRGLVEVNEPTDTH